jgi:hypothetical protein
MASISQRATVALAALRGLGAPSWFAPTLSCNLLGLPRNGEQTRDYWYRLFLSRDCALAAWAVSAPEGSAQRRIALGTGIAVDAADAAAWVAASRRGELPRVGAVALAGLHVAAIALGAAALATDAPATGSRAA